MPLAAHGVARFPFDALCREALAAALTHPVRWRLTLALMRAAGAERFLEAGPGNVLARLVRRCLKGVETGTLTQQSEVVGV